MIENKIVWRNIFYFLNYCDDRLRELKDGIIDFENIIGLYDLLATILNISFEQILRFGYTKQYEDKYIITENPYDIIDVEASYTQGIALEGKMLCKVSELTIDTKVNQVIKLAYNLLLLVKDRLSQKTLREVVQNYRSLSMVSNIDITDIDSNENIDIPKYYGPALAISQLIINDWVLMDKEGKYKLYTLTDESRAKYIWESFLRNYTKEYLLSIDKTFNVYKRKIVVAKCDSDTFGVEPDIIIKGCSNIPLVILDAKWYTIPKITADIRLQLSDYANTLKDKNPSRDVKAVAVFGHHKESSTEYIKLNKGTRFKMAVSVINVNQRFEQIKQDIRNMVNEQLELSEAT